MRRKIAVPGGGLTREQMALVVTILMSDIRAKRKPTRSAP